MTFLFERLKQMLGGRNIIGPKRAFLIVLITVLIAFGWLIYRSGVVSPILVQNYQKNHPIIAVFLFISLFAFSVMTALPSLPLNLAAGYFWGGVLGGVYSTLGAALGGWISFALARSIIGQPLAKKFDSKWINFVQNEFRKSDWKFVAFARINPIIPTGPLNYLLGLTSLSNFGFLWVTLIFPLLPSIAIATIGDTLQTFASEHSKAKQIIHEMLIVSCAITFLVLLKYFINIYKKQTVKS